MKSVGIIAEYNPFHRGHSRQISFLKEQGVENIAVALSGPFVQRGAPAWTDKRLRTKMALEQGVDFVFELPVLYALSSAEGFAWGGISLLNALPLDGVCFGSECGELAPLQKIADFLTQQDRFFSTDCPSAGTSEYQQYLRDYLKSGISYPAAREKALSHFFPKLLTENPGLLSDANDILAIEYLKALKKINSPLRPLTLSRNDTGYHSRNIDAEISSASAIRHAYAASSSLEGCRHAMPESVYSLLQKNPQRYPLQTDDFSSLLYLRLRQAKSPEEYTVYGNISPELARRMWKSLPDYRDASSYIQSLKAKNNTHSSISRAMACLLLNITTQLEQAEQGVPYLRLLGMRREKSGFLRQITRLPLITKVADYEQILKSFYRDSPEEYTEAQGTAHERHPHTHKKAPCSLTFALDCFEKDLEAADIYRQVMYEKLGYMLPDEYRCGIEIV